MIWNLLLGVALLTSTAASATNEPAPPALAPAELLAHGTDEAFWIARIEPVAGITPATLRTSIYERLGGQSTWQTFGALPARVTDLASRGDQLALLLENGDWVAASETSSTTGAPLPGGARMVAIAGDADSFWALGRMSAAGASLFPDAPTSSPGSIPAVASTQAATKPSSREAARPTTAPTTATATSLSGAGNEPSQLGLFTLIDGQWKLEAALPGDVNPLTAVRLCVVRRTPWVTLLDEPRHIRVLRSRAREWIAGAAISTPADVVAMKLIGRGTTPVLWVADAAGGESLQFLFESLPPRVQPFPPGHGAIREQTVALAAGRLHLLSSADSKGTSAVLDQQLDADSGLPAGGSSKMILATASAYPDITHVTQAIVWAALIFAIVSSLRWRRAMQGRVFDLEALQLAPLWLRLLAGSIDFLPALMPLLFLLRPGFSSQGHAVELLEFGCAPLYLLHTTIIETVFHRSLGKMLLGLSVVSIDGGSPSLASLLIRNLLRVIDVGLGLMPLAVILFSPLRQRTGDVAAGTLVVYRPAGDVPVETEEAEASIISTTREPAGE